MVILHSDGMGITNWDNVNRLVLNGRYITAHMSDGTSHHVAAYDDPKRTDDIFRKYKNAIKVAPRSVEFPSE